MAAAYRLPAGARWLPGWFGPDQQRQVLAEIAEVIRVAPLYVPTMPRTGKEMSVRMTNCGALGWMTDKVGGYRYQATHPVTHKPWPPIPSLLHEVWREVSNYAAPPEACLVNVYREGARMGSHQDRDEADLAAPVLSVSLGDDAVFHVGGRERADPKTRVTLRSGDVFVLGGQSRLAYHGVDRIEAGSSDLLPDGGRINLTLRRVSRP